MRYHNHIRPFLLLCGTLVACAPVEPASRSGSGEPRTNVAAPCERAVVVTSVAGNAVDGDLRNLSRAKPWQPGDPVAERTQEGGVGDAPADGCEPAVANP